MHVYRVTPMLLRIMVYKILPVIEIDYLTTLELSGQIPLFSNPDIILEDVNPLLLAYNTAGIRSFFCGRWLEFGF